MVRLIKQISNGIAFGVCFLYNLVNRNIKILARRGFNAGNYY